MDSLFAWPLCLRDHRCGGPVLDWRPPDFRLCRRLDASFNVAWTPYFVVPAGQTMTIADLRIVPTGGFVTGHVVLSAGGGPVLGATVFVTGGNNASTTTDANGFFTLALQAGTTNVRIKKTGYADFTSAPLVVATGVTTDLGTLNLDQSGVVTGRVINASTGAGIYATLTVTGTSGTTMSAADGSFNLMAPPGTRTLTATRLGFAPLTTPPISVIAGDSLSAGVLALTPGGTITGTVRDALTQANLYGVDATITGTSNTVKTDSSGRFSLAHAQGLWTVTLSKSRLCIHRNTSLRCRHGRPERCRHDLSRATGHHHRHGFGLLRLVGSKAPWPRSKDRTSEAGPMRWASSRSRRLQARTRS